MTSYTAGTVSARIELDTSDFDKEVKSLQTKIDELKVVMSKNGLMDLNTQIKELQGEVKRLSDANADYKKKLSAVREEKDKLVNSGKKQEEQEKKVQKTIDETTNSLNKETEAVKKLNNETKKATSIPKGESEIDIMIRKREKLNRLIKEGNIEEAKYYGKGKDTLHRAGVGSVPKDIDVTGWKRASEVLGQFQQKQKQILSDAGLYSRFVANSKTINLFADSIIRATSNIGNMSRGVGAGFKDFFASTSASAEAFKQRLNGIADQLKAKWHSLSVELAQANAATYKYWKQVRGNADVKGYSNLGTLDTGINQYYGQIEKINEALARFKREQQSVNDNINQTYSSFSRASEGIALLNQQLSKYESLINKGTTTSSRLKQQMSQLTAQVKQFSNSSQLGQKALATENRQLQMLGNRLKVLSANYSRGKISGEQYRQGLDRIEKELSQLHTKIQTTTRDLQQNNLALTKNGQVLNKNSAEWKKLEANARAGGRGLTSFNNGVVQTAHSGRILSNTLYQLRGALLSLKMIFTAMGGMALWGFATQVAEGVKETFKAKNEMEAQLKQNSKVDSSGIAYFNQELDKLTDRFQKINKYSIGETVSSIGLEFNLSAKEMADFSDIVAMIQSEYVRAGRKESEAALAVKDILQGEFQRLSRETGVGKEELIAYGWNEDKTDIESLTDALRKAALDRHWDIFAAKATSLNDVLTIMKSRFSETGADLMQAATPMIVGAFNDIISAIDTFGNAWNNMGSFDKSFISLLGGGALFGGILTALPMVTKGMGLAEISTIGFGKSILTAAFNLNKAEVAQYGFRKALAAVISGTKASELANRRATSAILGRVLGVNQAVQAEQGLMGALVHSSMSLKGVTLDAKAGAVVMGNLRQKIIYLAKGEIVADKASATWGKTLKSLIISTKLLRLAILGITAIGLAAWFASVAAWADTVKKRVDSFNDTLNNGKKNIKDATDTYDKLQKKLDETDKKSKKYDFLKSQAETAKYNVKDLTLAYEMAKKIKKEQKETVKTNDLSYQTQLNKLYKQNGVNLQKGSAKYQEMKQVAYDLKRAEEERANFEYASVQHIKEHTDAMKKANMSEDARVKYITEYSSKAKEAAENLKKFNEGDASALLYYAINRLQLIWIDLWNDDHFVKFWDSVKKTWDTLKPTIERITELLGDLGHTLLDFATGFLSTDFGKWTAGLAAAGTVIGIVGLKIGKWITGSKSVFQVLKKVSGKLKDVAKGWKDVGDNAEEASKKTGGDTTSTGGINGETGGKLPKTRGEWWQNTKGQIYNDATKYARAVVAIAAGMALITEALVLLRLPMGALAEVGTVYKRVAPNIQEGIEGLKVVAPTIIAIMTPAVALAYIMGKYEVSSETILKGSLKAAAGIAVGLGLVTEALLLLNLPLLSLALLGGVYDGLKSSVDNGVKAIQTVTTALESLVPWIPVFAAGIALGILMLNPATSAIGVLLTGGAAIGIAAGIGLVTEAMVLMFLPLEGLKELGDKYPNLDGVKRGAEAIKVTAEALKYVADAMTSLTQIDLNLLAQVISDVVGKWLGVDLQTKLTDLTGEGGVLDQLNDFTKKFNSDEFQVETPNPDKVSALASAGDGIKTIGDAMQKVKTAMDNLPPEFKNKGDTGKQLGITGNNADGTSSTTSDVSSYFDQFKEPLRQLKSFVYDFNNSDEFNIEAPAQERIDAINQSASMIEQVNTAVEKVKTVMQNIGNSKNSQAYAEGGILGMADTWLYGGNPSQGAGDYASSLGSSFKEMEDILNDLKTFQGKVSGLSGEGTDTDVSGLATFVTNVSQQIDKLATTLSSKVPTIKQNATNLGKSVVDGVKSGLTGLPSIGSSIPPKLANGIMTNKEMVYNTSASLGKTTASKFKTGVDPMSEYMTWELSYVKKAMTDRSGELGQTAHDLGSYLAGQFKEGMDQHSPGLIARSMSAEMGYTDDAMVSAMPLLGQRSAELGNVIGTNFAPNLTTDMFNVNTLSSYQTGLNQIQTATDKTGLAVSNTYGNIESSQDSALMGMESNNIQAYNKMYLQSNQSLVKMRDSTSRVTLQMVSAWKHMKNSIVTTADSLKTQTTSHFNKLSTTIGTFYRKIQNPSNWGAGAGAGVPSRARARRPSTGRRAVRTITSKHGAGYNPYKSIGKIMTLRELKSKMGDSALFNGQDLSQRVNVNDFLSLFDGGFGWDSIHFDYIKNKSNSWKMTAPLIMGRIKAGDGFKVGDFTNGTPKFTWSQFLSTAEALFSEIPYRFYWNSEWKGDWVSALKAGATNCSDGSDALIALAQTMGFDGEKIHTTTRSGLGHFYALINGHKMDTTNFQHNRSWTPLGAGALTRHTKRTNGGGGKASSNGKVVHNHGDTVVNINAPVYGVDDLEKAIENGVNKAKRKLLTKSLSGV